MKGIFVNFNLDGLVSEILEDDTIIFKIVIGGEITDFRFTAVRSDDQRNPEVGEITTFRFGGLKEEFDNTKDDHTWLKSDWTRLSKYISAESFFSDNEDKDEQLLERYNSREKKIFDIYINTYIGESRRKSNLMEDRNEVYNNNEIDDFEWGGLSGEEAIIGYWNTN